MDAIAQQEADSLRSLEETARFFDVSAPTLREWIVQGCPVAEQGGPGRPYRLDLRAVNAWRKKRRDEDAAASEQRQQADAQLRMELLGDDTLVEQDGERDLSPRQRQDLIRAELERVKLGELRRELVRAADVAVEMSAAFGIVRDRLRGLPDTLATKYGLGPDVADAILQDVDSLLDELADAVANINLEQRSDDGNSIAA